MNLYIQILSQVQTSEVVKLLLFPSLFQNSPITGKIAISAGGRLLKKDFDSVQQIISKQIPSRFNQIEIVYRVNSDQVSSFPEKIVSVVGLFTPSPTNELWYKSTDWSEEGNRYARTRRMNAKAAEAALQYYQVNRKPTVMEIVVQVDSGKSAEDVLDIFANWFAQSVPKEMEPLDIFGCVDVGGEELFIKLEANVLMTSNIRVLANLLPSAYPDLGERFDALHPVLFGRKHICEEIGNGLGKDAEVISGKLASNFAVLRLTGEGRSADAQRRVSNWLLLPSITNNSGQRS